MNQGRTYTDSIKPMNFALTAFPDRSQLPEWADRERFQLLAPFESDATRWTTMDWVDRQSRQTVRSTTDPTAPPSLVVVRTIGDEIERYWSHPEPKSAGPDGAPCGPKTAGVLQRRPVAVERIVYVGKESNRWEEVEQGLITRVEQVRATYEDPTQDAWTLLRPLLPHVSITRVAKTARVSTRMVKSYRRGEKAPSPKSLRRLLPLLWRVADQLGERPTANEAEQLRTRQAMATLETLMAHHGLTVR